MTVQRIQPGPGQESVWDYSRPPCIEPTSRQIEVVFNGVSIAKTARAMRVLETGHPPVYYIPPDDVMVEVLQPDGGTSLCEWKGIAHYYSVKVGNRQAFQAAWSYLSPRPGFEPIAGYLAFYPGKMDHCTVDGELVQPQPGGFYGGWITSDVVGPFKGGPGTRGW